MADQTKIDFEQVNSDLHQGSHHVCRSHITSCSHGKIVNMNEYLIKSSLKRKAEEEQILLKRVLDLNRFAPNI